MSKRLSLSMLMAVTALGVTGPLHAQVRSAVSGAELDAAVAARPAASAEAVRKFLATDQAQEAASRLGVSASELSSRVASLDQASLNQIAERTDSRDRILAGGADTIVIGTTTAIIIVLLIILLVR